MLTTIVIALGIFFLFFGCGCGLIAFVVPGKDFARDKEEEKHFKKQRHLALKGCMISFASATILFVLSAFLDYIVR